MIREGETHSLYYTYTIFYSMICTSLPISFSTLAIFYIYYFMDETQGLSEKQKKELFIPGAKFGRKLKMGEIPPPGTPTPATRVDTESYR